MTSSRRRTCARRTRACAATLAAALCFAGATLAGPTVAGANKVNPGSLPQTTAEPGVGAALTAQMTVLWRAILHDDDAQGRDDDDQTRRTRQCRIGLSPGPGQRDPDHEIHLRLPRKPHER